jgi:hypothetical protein
MWFSTADMEPLNVSKMRPRNKRTEGCEMDVTFEMGDLCREQRVVMTLFRMFADRLGELIKMKWEDDVASGCPGSGLPSKFPRTCYARPCP